jgi:hypothetical protein
VRHEFRLERGWQEIAPRRDADLALSMRDAQLENREPARAFIAADIFAR